MGGLSLKKDARFDLAALGEVMLRLDPGESRIRSARSFKVWEGGGEYNVARGLRRCFGKKTALISALPDNDLGRLAEELMLAGGVDLSQLKWLPFDGLGASVRMGLNFTERGFGVRAALGVSDRARSAASQMKTGDADWKQLFEIDGCKLFHTGGIFASLSESTGELALEGMAATRKAGTLVSYDLNYRPSLWKSRGGKAAAIGLNRKLAAFVDILIGNEEDFGAALGFETGEAGADFSELDPEAYRKTLLKVSAAFPNIRVLAATLRRAETATRNDWGAVALSEGQFAVAPLRKNLEIMDRVGGGDSFASGLLYGLLEGRSLMDSLQYGTAHGALAMTTPGDTSMVTLAEVEKILKAGTARVER